jgi:tryptophan synthase alpha chain
MSRYARMFERLAAKGEGAFGAFLMLGDPDLEASARLLDAVVASGADMVEVGIPFSDPVADGPVIQAAGRRALAAGVRVADCFGLIRAFRTRYADVPLGILTYANIAIAPGYERFCARAAEAGADSLLVADVPTLEAEPFAASAKEAGLDWVMIAATNSAPASLERIARLGSGYTYCVTRFGVTGARESLELEHGELFERLRGEDAPPPVLGFGISSAEHVASALVAGAKGVIVGSAVVALAEQADAVEAVRDKVRALKDATFAVAAHSG